MSTPACIPSGSHFRRHDGPGFLRTKHKGNCHERPKGDIRRETIGVPPTGLKRLARVAGVSYFAVGVTGGFSEGFMDPALYVAGDPTATAGNLVASTGLVQLAVVAHLMDAVLFVLTAATLYVLLKHVGKHAARLMVLPVIVAASIISVSAVFTFTALQVATTDTYVPAFGQVGANALALLLLEIEHYGIFAAQVFFGLWLAPLGYLAYRSRLFPKLQQLSRRHAVQLRPRMTRAAGRAVTFADRATAEYDTVLWATGFTHDNTWIDLPGVTDKAGRIQQSRGVTPSPGLYTLGLAWQHTRGSALLGWVGNDAAFIAQQIEARTS
jgi:hypothetical protein